MLDRVTIDQLRSLIAVADTGSFSAAARSLSRVQSAVSQSVSALESALGTTLFDRSTKVPQLNDAGRVILEDARHLVRGVETLKERAASIAAEIEPELTLAADPVFPGEVLLNALRDFAKEFPQVPVTLFTEALGAPEQRLLDGAVRLALLSPYPSMSPEIETEFLVSVPIVPVAAPSHPLAAIDGPIDAAALEASVQLVLTDRTPLTSGISGGVVSSRIWRFADQATRLDYLLAGFGWCNMPIQTVRDHIRDGRLRQLALKTSGPRALPVHVAHRRGRPPGKAGLWLIDELRASAVRCVGAGMAYGEHEPIVVA
ncbi:MAG: LysR family transcriptional regulator [Bauldia sp.]